MTPTNSPHLDHSPSRLLRRIGRAMKSRTTTLERVEDARSTRALAEQVQFVRSFRM